MRQAASLYRSIKKGAIWQRLDHEISIDSTVTKLAGRPREPVRIYRAAHLERVFDREDDGVTGLAVPLPADVFDVRAALCL